MSVDVISSPRFAPQDQALSSLKESCFLRAGERHSQEGKEDLLREIHEEEQAEIWKKDIPAPREDTDVFPF